MSILNPGEKIVATGTYLHAGEFECDLRIVFSPVRYGSGDYEDPPDIGEDVVADTYYVQYGSTTQRGVFSAGGGGYPSLAEARSVAEVALGIARKVVWHTGAA